MEGIVALEEGGNIDFSAKKNKHLLSKEEQFNGLVSTSGARFSAEPLEGGVLCSFVHFVCSS
jgi:hypothetical protein